MLPGTVRGCLLTRNKSIRVPVLVDARFRDSQRKLMLFANNNGFFYLLDRESGEFLLARQFAKQTWADGIDGRFVRRICG